MSERLLIAIVDGDDVTAHDTGLRGELNIERGGFVVPFASTDNAVDCLRILVQSLRDGGNGDAGQ